MDGEAIIPGAHIRPLAGGANGRSFRLDTPSGVSRFLKIYSRDAGDPRDRLGSEVRALSFLKMAGFKDVPELVAVDHQAGIGLFDWIDGTPITDVGSEEIAAALDFLGRLHGARGRVEARSLDLASEACLSPSDAVRQIERRCRRLAADAPDVVKRLLESRVAPLLTAFSEGIEDTPLIASLTTLSPSDFGFHNALRTGNGRITFLDFEYFGWDDPVKLVSDFILHPAMDLSEPVKRQFVAGARSIYSADERFSNRLKAMLPIYDLRWCTIILNAFDPAHHARFVGDEERRRRLDKVLQRLERLEREDRDYGLGE